MYNINDLTFIFGLDDVLGPCSQVTSKIFNVDRAIDFFKMNQSASIFSMVEENGYLTNPKGLPNSIGAPPVDKLFMCTTMFYVKALRVAHPLF